MTLVDEYLDWLHDRGCSVRTINDRREILTRIDNDLPAGVVQATTDELRSWLYRDDWSAATKATYYGAVRGLFVWATSPIHPRLDYDPSDPTLLPRPKVPRRIPKPVTDDQFQIIMTRATEPYLTWCKLAAYAGLRCIEIAGLRREHVTERTTIIARGKGGDPGVIDTHPIIWAAVRDLPRGPVARTVAGEPATAHYISLHGLLYFRRRLGLPKGVSMHCLRHWYGTQIQRRWGNIRITQEALRHAHPGSTAGYTLVADEERRAAIHALPTVTKS